MSTKNLTFAIMGLGGRGTSFSHVLHEQPELGTVVAIADIDPVKRTKVGDLHKIPANRRFVS